MVFDLSLGAWSARIDPNCGANLIALRHEDRDILRPLPEDNRDPFLVGAPLLLPANRTAGAAFTFGGKTYTLPANDALSGAHLHGRLYNAPFRVTEVQPHRAVLEYENRGEIYPLPFRIRVCYTLTEKGLHSEYTIENPGETTLPFTFGLHTTFMEPEVFRVPLLDCQEKNQVHIPTGRHVPLKEQEQAYVTGSASRGVVISGYYRAAGDTAFLDDRYRYRVKGFDHWVLYNARGENALLCLEPQLGGVNALNDPDNCPVLAPGAWVKLETWLEYMG